MVPNYPDHGTKATCDDTGATDISSIMSCFPKAMQNLVISANDLANAIKKVMAVQIKKIDFDLVAKKLFNESIRNKKRYCYFLSFVLFLVAYKGILPHPCRDIRNDETPYGFG